MSTTHPSVTTTWEAIGTTTPTFSEVTCRGVRWRWDAWRKGLPRRPEQPIPHQAPDMAHLHANAGRGMLMQPGVTWIAHATVLAQQVGLSVLTDPKGSDRLSPNGWR